VSERIEVRRDAQDRIEAEAALIRRKLARWGLDGQPAGPTREDRHGLTVPWSSSGRPDGAR